jgi:hypothetical protein
MYDLSDDWIVTLLKELVLMKCLISQTLCGSFHPVRPHDIHIKCLISRTPANAKLLSFTFE